MIVITGGSGKAGRACMSELVAHGYELCNIDLVTSSDPDIPFSQVDLTDFGQTMAALSAIDERVHNVTGIIGLRLSNVMSPEDYARFPGFQDEARKRKWNVWSYIDARDAAQAFRLALEVDLKGAEVFIIANADTVMFRNNKELLAEVFPDVPQKSSFGPNDSLFSIEKARRVLKYDPKYSWRSLKTS